MGRYYSGDIEGKFWFGVQSSSDADYFGCEGEPRYLSYYFDEDSLTEIEQGIHDCLHELDEDKARLDAFFKETNGYNNEMIVSYYESHYGIKIDDKFIREKLQWYARLALGKEILECVKEQGSCSFDAEL
jgi:hypothetical protein